MISSYLWASPTPPPLELVVVADYVHGTAAALAAEGLWEGRTHPPNSYALSLVGGGVPGPLADQRRSKHITLLLLLILNPLVDPPPLPTI